MNKHDLSRNFWMLDGSFAKQGYDWWWHSLTGINEKTGQEKAFFVEYFTCNPALANKKDGGQTPTLGQAPESKEKGLKPSYLMVKCGWWGQDANQLHQFIPWKDVSIKNEKNGFQLQAPGFSASDTHITGKVEITDSVNHPEWMCGDGSMEWDLSIEKDVAFNVGYGASKIFRDLKAFEMYWHAEGMKSRFQGYIIANGQKYIIKKETSFGYSDKNWGCNFTSPWVWLSSNDLVSKKTGKRLENSVFDIGGGCPKVFGIALKRKLLSDFWYEGKSYEFNFSKFWTCCRTKFDCKETEDKIIWYVRQETKKAIMETQMECPKSQMLLVNYESPDGKKRHTRLWNGGTGYGNIKLYKKSFGKTELLDEIEAKHAGCEWGEYER